MDRSTTLLLIAIGLVGYGIYIALYVPAMLLGPSDPLLLIGFILQAVFGIVAGIAVWRRWPWAAGAVLLLGTSIAVTELIEGFVLGIIAYLYALLVAVIAIVIAVVVAVYVHRQDASSLRSAN